MHENIQNYAQIIAQPDHIFRTRIDVAGTFNNFSIGDERLISAHRTAATFADDVPSVGCCVSSSLKAEFLADFEGTAEQEAFRGVNVTWNQLWDRAGWKHCDTAITWHDTWWFGDVDTPFSPIQAVANHKYYAKLKTMNCNSNVGTVAFYYGNSGRVCNSGPNTTASAIFSPSSTNANRILRVFNSNAPGPSTQGATLPVMLDYKLLLVDLTVMFGAGNEPTTTAEFEALVTTDYSPFSSGVSMDYDPFAIPKMGQLSVNVFAEAEVSGTLTQSGDIPKGIYFIDTRQKTHNGDGLDVMTVEAFDAMLKLERPCYTEMPITWTNVPMQTVLNHICTETGLEVDDRTRINQSYTAEFPGVGEGAYTMREVLGFIGAANCGNWIVNDYGKLQLIPLSVEITDTNYLLDEAGYPLTFGGTRILITG